MTLRSGHVGMMGGPPLEETINHIVPAIFMQGGTRFQEYSFRSTKKDADKIIHLVHTHLIDEYYL